MAVASVGSVVRLEPWAATVEGPSVAAVRAELARAFRNGEIGATGQLWRTPDGRYAVTVLRLKDRPVAPAWRRPALVSGGVVIVLGAAAAAGWLLVSSTVAVAGAIGLPLIAVSAALLWLAYAAASSSSDCTITITHRRH